jgi:hypothetical protein
MASNITLGGIDLPDGIDPTNGAGRVYWLNRDQWAPVSLSTARSLGGRLFFAQRQLYKGRQITLDVRDHAWLLETAKDAIRALSETAGKKTFVWYGESYQVLFDSEDGDPCPFEPLLIGRHLSKTNWVGEIRLLTTD